MNYKRPEVGNIDNGGNMKFIGYTKFNNMIRFIDWQKEHPEYIILTIIPCSHAGDDNWVFVTYSYEGDDK